MWVHLGGEKKKKALFSFAELISAVSRAGLPCSKLTLTSSDPASSPSFLPLTSRPMEEELKDEAHLGPSQGFDLCGIVFTALP